ncbi:MAG TPA: hypothetical protein VLE23_10285 [Geminicoccaceae bacterium]|nr:hypothetical protein [Geminicoccaceae bacterium]
MSQLHLALQDELARVYALARLNAEGTLQDHGEPAAADALPATCPYTLDQIPPTGGQEHHSGRKEFP